MLIRRFSTLGRYKIGDCFKLTRTLRQEELDQFSELTGDSNPLHRNEQSYVHGAFLNGIIGGIIGSNLQGYAVISQTFKFPNKCVPNEAISFVVRLEEIRKIVTVKYECKQNGQIVFEGDAKLKLIKKNNEI